MFIKPTNPDVDPIKSGNITTIALPEELVVIVVDITLEYNPVLVEVSEGIRQETSSGASMDKIA